MPASGPVVAATVVLEVLEAPVLGRRYAWGLQAGVVDEAGRRVGEVVDSVVRTSGGEWERSSWGWSRCGGAMVAVGGRRAARLRGSSTSPCGWTWPRRRTTRRWWRGWSGLSCRLASGGSAPVSGVQVTFPQGSEWRRLDVVVDEVGVLQVSNTARTAANLSVLALPPDR